MTDGGGGWLLQARRMVAGLRLQAAILGSDEADASEAVRVPIGALGAPHGTGREAAAPGPAEYEPAEARPALPALVVALGDEDVVVRRRVAMALGMMGAEAKEAVPALTAALGDPSDAVRLHAAAALGEIGPEARPALA